MVAALTAVAALALVVVGRWIGSEVDQSRAQAAADAAALAAARAGPSEARSVALADGAEVISIDVRPDRVTVVVRRGTVDASASATVVVGGPSVRGAPAYARDHART